MMYPAIVILAMVVIGMLMMIFVVPILTQTFQELNVTLPLTTRILLGVSTFLSTHTIISLGLIGAAVAGMFFFYRTSFGRVATEWTLLRVPIIGGLIKETNAARTAR